jgi:hypothetical protein
MAEVHTNLKFDQAAEFLRLLDPSGKFTFQTFEDRKPPTRPELTGNPPLDNLLQLHALGAGVYITINATNSGGRKSENITAVRAVWQEDDGGFDGEFPLAPSMVVETSPGHFHRYWLVDNWPADAQGRADFAAVMERMVESYGSDKGAKDISRVLRIPSFLHRKSETPHLVKLVDANGRRYSRAEIIAAFPPVERQQQKTVQREWKPQDDDDQRIGDALASIAADQRDLWLQCGMALKAHMGESGRPLWDQWSRRSDKYNERDQDKTWRSFRRNGIGIGTLFHHARQAGWQPPKSNGAANGATPGNADKPHNGSQDGRRLIVHRASDIKPVPVEWLWSGRLAKGKTTLLGGDPGVGKSQLSIFIAATISKGGQWPCEEGIAPKKSVVILCAEDGPADTIVPRVMAAEGDVEKIEVITAVTNDQGGDRRIFNLSNDLDLLEDHIKKIGDVGLVIIDPVDAYIGAGVDSHKNAAVRAVLEPISELADRLGVAILAVTHFSKQAGSKAMYRFIGSIAHVGSARVAFAVIADAENEGRALVLHAKNNLALPQKGLAYRLEQRIVTEGVVGSSVQFEAEHVSGTADEALAAERDPSARNDVDDAEDFLLAVLADGPVKVEIIEKEAKAAGLLGVEQSIGQSKPFRSARSRLGIKPYQPKGEKAPGWAWALPPIGPPGVPIRCPQTSDALDCGGGVLSDQEGGQAALEAQRDHKPQVERPVGRLTSDFRKDQPTGPLALVWISEEAAARCDKCGAAGAQFKVKNGSKPLLLCGHCRRYWRRPPAKRKA